MSRILTTSVSSSNEEFNDADESNRNATIYSATNSPESVAVPPPVAASSVLSCGALVAGTTVGAGIIALPAKTLAAGFGPSALVLILGWLYMVSTGLLIAEVNINTIGCIILEQEEEEELTTLQQLQGVGVVSMNTMAEETLGSVGAAVSSLAFGFLHYALLAAYTIQGGTLLKDAAVTKLGSSVVLDGTDLSSVINSATPTVVFPGVFAAGLGLGLFGLGPRNLERLNTLLVIMVVVSFAGLLLFGIDKVDVSILQRANFGAVVDALPLMPVVYVFQTVVPTVCALLQCDAAKIRTALVAGTGIPLFMFLSWSAVILGTIPYDPAATVGDGGAAVVVDPLQALRSSGSLLGDTILVFSLIAVATSFIGFAYGLVDFFADLFSWESPLSSSNNNNDYGNDVVPGNDNVAAKSLSLNEGGDGGRLRKKLILATLVVVPPIVVATLDDPTLFFATLDNAGTYGILVLFGLIPTAMTWSMRYSGDEDTKYYTLASTTSGGEPQQQLQDYYIEPDALVPGGRISLGVLFLTAIAIIGLETYEKFSAQVIPAVAI